MFSLTLDTRTIHYLCYSQKQIVMRYLSYDKVMGANPTEYDRMTNILGQEIVFYEHPSRGDNSPVLAVHHNSKIVAITSFWETDDMMPEDSDYSLLVVGDSFIEKCDYDRDQELKEIEVKLDRYFGDDREGLIGSMVRYGFTDRELRLAEREGLIRYLGDDESVVTRD